MEFHFTRHARNRMRLYDIPEQVVRKTLEHPEQLTEGSFGCRHAWTFTGGNQWLRITFKDEGTRRVVITVTPKDIGPGG
jgi:hypothetical protein